MNRKNFRKPAAALGLVVLALSALTVTNPETARRNHLAAEKSPYLLQHAHNPVWWWAWGPDALAEAKKQDKPIFLSIGYSTCHWCHVMEHESFEKEDVALSLNESFIAIKVDREERPDLDAHYMRAVQIMTGSGGWPMTTILLPDGRPFFGATYIPHDALIKTLAKITEAWKNDRNRIERIGQQLAQGLTTAPAAGGGLTAQALLDFAAQQAERFDPVHGGTKGAPKFPPAYALRTLLRIERRKPDPRLRAQVVKTFDEMARGGMYDHVGGGFHRYSTDDHWLVPHFEKMLYDQAALVNAYLDGYAATGNGEYAAVVRETLDYVLRDMTSPEGAFYSAEDADSEGVEGKFYVWSEAELKKLLPPQEFHAVAEAFGATKNGNFEGKNILNLVRGDRTHRSKMLASALMKMRATRARRIRPLRDDKVITSWNGLMITAFVRAARTLDEPRYLSAAQRAAGFLLAHARAADGGLLRRWREGEARYPAFLTDYANLIDGLLELYQVDFDSRWLSAATALQALQEKKFAAPGGGYYSTDGSDPSLPGRTQNFEDDVRPAGTSVAAHNLLRLGDLLLDDTYHERATALFKAAPPEVAKFPSAFPVLLAALDYQLDGGKEVAIAGDPVSPTTKALLAAVRAGFHPNQVVAVGVPGADSLPLLKDKIMIHGLPTAYVCERKVCKFPTTDPATVARQVAAFQTLK